MVSDATGVVAKLVGIADCAQLVTVTLPPPPGLLAEAGGVTVQQRVLPNEEWAVAWDGATPKLSLARSVPFQPPHN